MLSVLNTLKSKFSGKQLSDLDLSKEDLNRIQNTILQRAPHDYYSREYQHMERLYLPALFNELRPFNPSSILEIGPGWGTTALWLKERGHDITVMDLMPVGSFMTQEFINELGIRYLHHDIEDTPFPESLSIPVFDIVIMTQVIPHLAWRPDRAIGHIASLLKGGGTFFTSVLDRPDNLNVEATFGDNWRDVPEWNTTEKCTDVVKCMYNEVTFRELIMTAFPEPNIWKPEASTVLFANVK